MRSGAEGADLLRLRALGALRDLELDRLVLFEVPVAGTLDGGEVDEDVRAAAVLGDEAVALLTVEPLDRASCHAAFYLGITPACRGTGGGVPAPVTLIPVELGVSPDVLHEPTAQCDRASR